MTSSNPSDVKANIKTEDVKAASCSSEFRTEKDASIKAEQNDNNDFMNDFRSEVQIKQEAPVEDEKREDRDDYIHDFNVRNMPENYKEIYKAFVEEIEALSSIPILKSLSEESFRNFKPYNIRYYDDRYCIDFGVKERSYCDINIRIHTNKLFLIALASGNDIIQSQRDISEINFVINNVDRSIIRMRGKKKIGSKAIEHHTILCQVKYEGDDKLYNVRAGVKGRIIEINELLKKNPNLIRNDPKGLGFIAVVAPLGQMKRYEENLSKLNLLSEEEYVRHLLSRPPMFTMLCNDQ